MVESYPQLAMVTQVVEQGRRIGIAAQLRRFKCLPVERQAYRISDGRTGVGQGSLCHMSVKGRRNAFQSIAKRDCSSSGRLQTRLSRHPFFWILWIAIATIVAKDTVRIRPYVNTARGYLLFHTFHLESQPLMINRDMRRVAGDRVL